MFLCSKSSLLCYLRTHNHYTHCSNLDAIIVISGFDFLKRQQCKCNMTFNRKKCEYLKNIKAQYKDSPHKQTFCSRN